MSVSIFPFSLVAVDVVDVDAINSVLIELDWNISSCKKWKNFQIINYNYDWKLHFENFPFVKVTPKIELIFVLNTHLCEWFNCGINLLKEAYDKINRTCGDHIERICLTDIMRIQCCYHIIRLIINIRAHIS